MPIFKKKPVKIEARYNDGTQETATALMDWVNPDDLNEEAIAAAIQQDDGTWAVIIATLETEEGFKVGKGWWVIEGVEGEFYGCRDDIFQKTYEAVEA